MSRPLGAARDSAERGEAAEGEAEMRKVRGVSGEDSPRPVFFVSSVVDGFEEYREAARQGVEAAGGKALLVNEDLPSLATSSRNACLDGVESADCLLSIVGRRGGWTTPSGVLVVEEELEHARRRNIPVLAFLQKTTRDPEAERFARRLSDYIDGAFRITFDTPEELQEHVERAARGRISMGTRRTDEPDLSSSLRPEERAATDETLLRFVLVPAREGELVDPVRLASPEFEHELFGLGHAANVGLFNYRHAKSAEVVDDHLVIEQGEIRRRGEGHEFVRLTVAEMGSLVIDANVTGRVVRGSHASLIDYMVLALEDVEGVLHACFRFANAFYEALDRHHRHETFFYNAGLRGLGDRTLERNPQPRRSHGWSMRGNDVIEAFPRSRGLSQSAFSQPGREVAQVIATFERKSARQVRS